MAEPASPMNKDSHWLEELLLKERNDALKVLAKVLDDNRAALIAAFEANYSPIVEEQVVDVDAGCGLQELVVDPTPGLPKDDQAEHPESRSASKLTIGKRSITTNDATSSLVRAFDVMDKDQSGKLNLEEFRGALQKVGWSPSRARRMVKEIEILSKGAGAILTGEIYRDDWMRLVSGELARKLDPEIYVLADKLDKVAEVEAAARNQRSHRFMLSSLSGARLAWDILTAVCTLYVVTVVPLSLGFGTDWLGPNRDSSGTFAIVENFVDVVFLLDILVRFRTSYFTADGREVSCWRKVAYNYLTSWFLLDLCSSIPVSFFGESENAKSIKLVKFTRFFAIIKLMRTTRVFKVLDETRVGEFIDETIIEYRLYTQMRVLKIVVCLCACCHWLACAMAACGREFIRDIMAVSTDFSGVYIPAFYWAMTTCTTVGYGDLIPKNNRERIVAMVAMCVGGTFYGFVSGTFASIIASYDRATHERQAKLEAVHAWLHKHRFPPLLKRRIHYYFKSKCSAMVNCTADELSIVGELNSSLLTEASRVVLPEEIRSQVVFECVPGFVIGFLVGRLEVVSYRAGHVIMQKGDHGDAMYIIKMGHCEKQIPIDPKNSSDDSVFKIQLYTSESFGEEFILGLQESSGYTVSVMIKTDVYSIPKQLFQSAMEEYPEHLKTMRRSFESATADQAALLQDLTEGRLSNLARSCWKDTSLGTLDDLPASESGSNARVRDV